VSRVLELSGNYTARWRARKSAWKVAAFACLGRIGAAVILMHCE